MPVPVVAIVGRPNVGKSSLFNRLARRRISIVQPTPGVTRDRVGTVIRLQGRAFELVDTGGYGIEDVADLTESIAEQIGFALAEAAVVVFVVDVQAGLASLDEDVARLLRGCGRPVILAANKADGANLDTQTGLFHKLGFGEPLAVSALQGRGIDELRDEILRHLGPAASTEQPSEPVMKLAVVGKRNVGKSTFINCLARQQRMIVSEVPGTTRDSVDVRFEKDGKTFLAIDTAGLRKKSKLADDIEFYSYARATRSIRRADVVLLMIEATESISSVDKKLASYIVENLKPCVLVINKWDLVRGRMTSEQYRQYLEKALPGMPAAPLCFTTGLQGKNVQSAVDLAIELHKQAATRVSTAQLNKALEQVLSERGPGSLKGSRLPKIYYATQTGANPPEIVLFVNDPKLLGPSYQRYVSARLANLLPFKEIPVRLLFRSHRKDEPSDQRVTGAKVGINKPGKFVSPGAANRPAGKRRK